VNSAQVTNRNDSTKWNISRS